MVCIVSKDLKEQFAEKVNSVIYTPSCHSKSKTFIHCRNTYVDIFSKIKKILDAFQRHFGKEMSFVERSKLKESEGPFQKSRNIYRM